jgi:hypothetical protein
MATNIPCGRIHLLDWGTYPFDVDDDVPAKPHYFLPLEDGQFRDLSSRRVTGLDRVYTYLVADRSDALLGELAPKPSLTQGDWLSDSWRVFLDLDEAKRFGDLLYQKRHSVCIFTCPTVVFPTDDHYILVLDLNTRTPFSVIRRQFEAGLDYPRTVGKVGKLLTRAGLGPEPCRRYLKGIVSQARFSSEGLRFDEAAKPHCLGHSRSYVNKCKPRGGRDGLEAVAARPDVAEWLPQIWDISEEHYRQL